MILAAFAFYKENIEVVFGPMSLIDFENAKKWNICISSRFN